MYASMSSGQLFALRASRTKSVSRINFKKLTLIVFIASSLFIVSNAPRGCNDCGNVTSNTTFVFRPSTAPRFTSRSSVLIATRQPRGFNCSEMLSISTTSSKSSISSPTSTAQPRSFAAVNTLPTFPGRDPFI